MKQAKEAQMFDVFSLKTGSWKFLYAVEAHSADQAKEIAMKEHRIMNWNAICVHPKK